MCLAELGAKDTSFHLSRGNIGRNYRGGRVGSELSLQLLHIFACQDDVVRARPDGHLEFKCGRKVKSIRGRETSLISSFSTKPFFFLRVVRIPAS